MLKRPQTSHCPNKIFQNLTFCNLPEAPGQVKSGMVVSLFQKFSKFILIDLQQVTHISAKKLKKLQNALQRFPLPSCLYNKGQMINK
jgi:hypothetical protein